MRPGPSSERAVILAPTGRDAAVAAALISEAGYYANICGDLAALMREIEGGAGLAVIADEAIKTADLRGLTRWLNDQPSWSDFPIVLLTHQGGGPERNPDAVRLGLVLGNVTFIERPFHPTTLVSVVGSAVRGRRRQYQTRAILADLTESEDLLQTALNAGRTGVVAKLLDKQEPSPQDIQKNFDLMRDQILDQRRSEAFQLFASNVTNDYKKHNRIRINTLALAPRLPSMYPNRAAVEAGGLISYGANPIELFRQGAFVCRSRPQGRKARRLAGAISNEV